MPEQSPAPQSLGQQDIAVLAFLSFAVVADVYALDLTHNAVIPGLQVLATIFLVLAAAAFATWVLAMSILWSARVLGFSRGRYAIATLPAVIGCGFCFFLTFRELATGPKISQVSGIKFWIFVVTILVTAATWFALRVFSKLIAQSGVAARLSWRRRLGVSSLCLIFSVAFFAIDRFIFPRQYEAMHRLAGACALVCWIVGVVVLLKDWLSLRRWRWIVRPLVVVGFIAALLIAKGLIPGTDEDVRSWLFQRTQVSRRVMNLLPTQLLRTADIRDNTKIGHINLHRLPKLTRKEALVLDRVFPGRKKANVLWITIDTLRPDHCGFMGYNRNTTPIMDLLAKDSVVFANSYAQYPSSQFSLASMFTGLYPNETEARQKKLPNGLFKEVPHEQALTLSLRRSGWRALASSAFSNSYLEGLFAHIPPLFDSINPKGNKALLGADAVVDQAIEMLKGHDDSPFFFWLHIFDPHHSYENHPGVEFGISLVDKYDGEIAFADQELGRFVDFLKNEGLWKDLIVVLHSDHGEEFGEHGGSYHNSSLYDEQIKVPMMLRFPGLSPKRVEEVVELVDIVPTLHSLLDHPAAQKLQGDDLTPLLLGTEISAPDQLFAYSQLRNPTLSEGRLDALCIGKEKAIYDRGHGTWRLFDLNEDPQEKHNLAFADREGCYLSKPYLQQS